MYYGTNVLCLVCGGSGPRLEELKTLADAFKHADGRADDELRRCRPDLFLPETLRDHEPFRSHVPSVLYAPLSGDGIYVTMEDLKAFSQVAREFNELEIPAA